MAEELEKSDAEWCRKEEIRLGLVVEAGLSAPNGPRLDSDLSQMAALSQGDISTTHPILFPSPGAIYPALVDCDEPVDKIIDSLTGPSW